MRHKITDLKVWKCNFLVTIRRITIEAYCSFILEKQNWCSMCTSPAGTFDEMTNWWERLSSPILKEKQDDAIIPQVSCVWISTSSLLTLPHLIN